MIETKAPPAAPEPVQIHKSLIYEEIDGQPIYYRGYREVLAKQKQLEDIMGCSDVQGRIISVLLRYLYREVAEDQYDILTNEIGLHIGRGSNLSSDIAIYNKADIQKTPLKNRYYDIPPQVVIEVDMKADISEMGASYYHAKTEKLFSFGVTQVVWLFSESRKVMVAEPQQDWVIKNWDKPVTILDQYEFSVAALIEKGGIKLPD